MELPVLLINIERAAARRAAIERQASELGIKVEPVPGVDGGLVPREQWVGVDAELFRRRNGRTILPGEYGCYRSHLVAFRQLVDSGRPAALIIEDDVALSRDLMDRAQAIVDMAPGDCLIKLVNHRTVAFRPMFKSSKGDEVGLACFGPMGSSACYLVTLGAARKLLQGMANQSLPLDNALDRAIVVHAAWYANPDMISRRGMLGRSQGCFAVGEKDLAEVFERLGPGRMIYAAKV